MENEIEILEKLEEKLRSILSLRLKIELSKSYQNFEVDFEEHFLKNKIDELMLDIEDLVCVCEEDIKAEIDMDIELRADGFDLDPDNEQTYWT